MAVVKSKPTSAGRRHQVKVVTEGLHKGKPHGPLLEKKSKTGGRITGAASRLVTSAVVTSSITAKLISSAPKTVFRRRLSALNTILIAPLTSRCCFTPTASAATSSRRRVFRQATYCTQVLRHPSRQVTACRCAISPSAPLSTPLSSSPARAHRWRARLVRQSSWLPEKANTPPFDSAPARCARCQLLPRHPRRSLKFRAQSPKAGQSRCCAMEGCAAHGSRCCDEPGRSPAWWW